MGPEATQRALVTRRSLGAVEDDFVRELLIDGGARERAAGLRREAAERAAGGSIIAAQATGPETSAASAQQPEGIGNGSSSTIREPVPAEKSTALDPTDRKGLLNVRRYLGALSRASKRASGDRPGRG